MTLNIATVDAVVIGLYFVIVLLIGFYFARQKDSTDYFLAGRNMGWLAIGASLFATN
ncbi:MAG TPA: sodium transporter, partial [Candidatus Marinimicrobia bacterium]|nr:sodium transporter [Candidatus Neomarinimicrobiota bacterium]